MAWQYATAQGVYIPTFVSTDSKTPTTPTNPVVTISKDGAGLGAVAGTVTVVANFGVHVALTVADTACAAGAIKVTSDNCDPATLVFVTEGNYTADRATAIDTIETATAGLGGDAMPDISALALEATVAALNNFDPATQQVDIGAVTGTPVSSVDDFKANVSGLATSNEIADLQTHGDTEWAKVSAEDVDTQLSLTHGIGSWLTRADNGIHTVTVTVETSGGTTFEGVRVAASGLDESNQYVEDTDTAGECTFYLNAGTWRFIAAATGAQSGGTVDVDVSAAQDVSLVVTAVALPDPAPAGYCSVYAIGEYQNGADAAGTFRVSALRSPQVRDEDGIPVAVFLGDDSPALVDGRATVTVLQGAVVSFVLSTSGGTISRENVTVPSETGPVDFLSLT